MTQQATSSLKRSDVHDCRAARGPVITGRVLGPLVAILLALCCFSHTAVAGEVFHGQVVAVYGTQLRLSTGGLVVDFHVADDASVTLDGRQVSLYDLTPDHVAFVTAQRDDDRWIATVIDAWSQRRIKGREK